MGSSYRETLAPIEEYQAQLQEMALWLKDLETAPIEEDYQTCFIRNSSLSGAISSIISAQLSATPPLAEMPDFDGEILLSFQLLALTSITTRWLGPL